METKEPNSGSFTHIFSQNNLLRKFMHKISAVGLFCCDKFEETPKQKVINVSKLNKVHFNEHFFCNFKDLNTNDAFL